MKMTVIVVGASRGIGASVAQHFHRSGHKVFSVSRTQSKVGSWIKADISHPDGIKTVADSIGAEAMMPCCLWAASGKQGPLPRAMTL